MMEVEPRTTGAGSSQVALIELVRDIYLDAGVEADAIDASERSRLRPVWIDDFEGKVKVASTVLTPEVVQYLAGADGTKTVSRWISGETRPSIEEARRVCIASTIIRRFAMKMPEAVSLETTSVDLQAFFLGQNPTLAEDSPAEVIRREPFRVAAAAIAAAAIGTFA